jgi:hypothetical protein
MISFLRRHQKSIFAATITIFAGGMFVGFGGYWFDNRDMQGVVAKVGPVKIPYQKLVNQVDLYTDQARARGKELTDAEVTQARRELLSNMMVDEILSVKADELGVVVTEEELGRGLRALPAFRRGGQFDQDAYFTMVRSRFRMSPQEFEADQLKQMKAERVRSLLLRAAKVSPEELREFYAAANKGSMKDFDAKKDAFASQVRQMLMGALLRRCLEQMETKIDIRNDLAKFEAGAGA